MVVAVGVRLKIRHFFESSSHFFFVFYLPGHSMALWSFFLFILLFIFEHYIYRFESEIRCGLEKTREIIENHRRKIFAHEQRGESEERPSKLKAKFKSAESLR